MKQKQHQRTISIRPLIILVVFAVIVGIVTSEGEPTTTYEQTAEVTSSSIENEVDKNQQEIEVSIENIQDAGKEKASLYEDIQEETTEAGVQSILDSEEISNEEESTDVILEEYKDVDEYLLAQLLYCEAGGANSRNELLYVGKVALNRMTTDYHDFKSVNTLEEVINQKGQYASATKEKIAAGVEPTPECLEAAHALLTGEKIYYTGFDGETHEFGDNFYWQSLGDISGWCKPLFQTKCGHQYGIPSDE
jgi:hypothetical protein